MNNAEKQRRYRGRQKNKERKIGVDAAWLSIFWGILRLTCGLFWLKYVVLRI
jgi:hypothetical protein